MTREEACKKAKIIDFQGGYTIALVTEIYNDHEEQLNALQQTKRCNTCSFYHSYTGVCANDKCPLCADFVDADFGCIYHEVKE